MFIEKRILGKNIKYYLVHSYRDNNNNVQKIRRYLGSNLSEKELNKLRPRAEQLILDQLNELNTELFNFTLSPKEIKKLNKLNEKINIFHLDSKDWVKFTQDFVYNTNAIEGSTILRDEVPKILKKSNLTDFEEIETKGVANAVSFIRKTKEDLSLDLIKKLHKLCFDGSKSFAGKFRKVEVVIRDAKGIIVHQGIDSNILFEALNDFIKWFDKNKTQFKPLVLAAIVHNQFEHIHPFRDGNGRVGRLLLNFILIKYNYPPINILLEDRSKYYKTLQEYSKFHNLKPTIEFLVDQYNKTLSTIKGDH